MTANPNLDDDAPIETGKVFAWTDADGKINYRWALLEWRRETEAEALARVSLEVPAGAILVDEADLPPKAARHDATISGGSVVPTAEGMKRHLFNELAALRRTNEAKANAIAPEGFKALDRGDLYGEQEAAVAALKVKDDEIAAASRALRAWDGTGQPPALP